MESLKKLKRLIDEQHIYGGRVKEAMIRISDTMNVKGNNDFLMLVDSIMRQDVCLAKLGQVYREMATGQVAPQTPQPSPQAK